jgi:hypothetical protein
MPACSLLLVLAFGSFAALVAAARVALPSPDDFDGVAVVGAYSVAFLVFLTGFAAWTRSRSRSSGVPRVLLLGVLFLAFVGPWIAMAITGAFVEGDRTPLIAAPSPLFAFELRKALLVPGPERELAVLAGSAACFSWALIGLGLLALAGGKVERRRAQERAIKEQLEASLPPAAPAAEAATPSP